MSEMGEPLRQYALETASGKTLQVCRFGLIDYVSSLAAMREFAAKRDRKDDDQLWLLQHRSVYTQGTACNQQPLAPSAIETVKTDRGGQITYHGIGQWVLYPMLRLRDHGLGVKSFVSLLEQTVIDLLLDYQIVGQRRDDAPGVYVDGAKIAALGLRISRGTSYHGLSINVDMDLQPFDNIDPCGFQGLEVTQLSALAADVEMERVADQLLEKFVALLLTSEQ